MSAGAIEDDDLVQALEDLRYVATRLETLERRVTEMDEIEDYDRLTAIRVERADLREQIRVRAESRLNVPPRALLLMIEQANRLRSPRKQQAPTLAALANHLRILVDAAERDRVAAAAEVKLARIAERAMSQRHKAGADAIAYLEASRR